MIDPVTALATATAAFNAVKKGVEMGQDIENMAGAIGKWMGAVSDIDKSGEYAKKPPLFKKLFAKGSVEEEALAAFMAKKKAEDMREQLKQIIFEREHERLSCPASQARTRHGGNATSLCLLPHPSKTSQGNGNTYRNGTLMSEDEPCPRGPYFHQNLSILFPRLCFST